MLRKTQATHADVMMLLYRKQFQEVLVDQVGPVPG